METDYIFIIIISILSFICLVVFFYECIHQVIDCIVLQKKLKRYNTRIHDISNFNQENSEKNDTGIELNELDLNIENLDNIKEESEEPEELQKEPYTSGKEIVL